MPRRYLLLAGCTLTVLLVGAVPVAAAPVGIWSLFDRLSPFDWVRALWGGETIPWQRTGDGDLDPSDAPHAVWSEDGSAMDPLGQRRVVIVPQGNGV